MLSHKKKVIIVLVLVFIAWLFFDSVFNISSIIFSRFHFLDENKVGAQVIYGEEINKYTQVHWVDPDSSKMKQEYPERGLTFQSHYDGNNTTRIGIVDVFDAESNKVQSISLSGNKIQKVGWLDNGLFLYGTEDFPSVQKESDRDYFYDLEKKEAQPIQSDGLKKDAFMGIGAAWILHPKDRKYILETYCLSAKYIPGGDKLCVQRGVSIITSEKSTHILSFYHPFRKQLRIGWDDNNFYVKTGNRNVGDWVFGLSEQEVAQRKASVNIADSSDQMYIIPLKNLEKI